MRRAAVKWEMKEDPIARIPRLINASESKVYHVMSMTALDGFPLGDVEKDYLLNLIKKTGKLYFADILGFVAMSNHFHILLRMHPESGFSDQEIRSRLEEFYQGDRVVNDEVILNYRNKLGNLSEFVKEIKQGFTRYYNKEHKRRGFFWGQRFKSLIVENGETLINCLAYIDLNPIRANMVERPEDYRWCSLGYLMQTGNRDDFLSMEFGVQGEEKLNLEERIERYRRFVYEVGTLETEKGKSIDTEILEKQRKKRFKVTKVDCFKYRTRYFTDSGVIGSKKFVFENYQRFKELFDSKREKVPKPIKGLDGVFSLKRLATVAG